MVLIYYKSVVNAGLKCVIDEHLLVLNVMCEIHVVTCISVITCLQELPIKAKTNLLYLLCDQ